MGYQTSYRLSCEKPEIVREWIEKDPGGDPAHALCADGSSNERSRWYEHESDLRALSFLHPGVLFTLHGDGEESADIWTKHFRDGRMQVCRAEIVIPPFDPEKLEPQA